MGFDSAGGRSKFSTVKVPTEINNTALFADDSPHLRPALIKGIDYEVCPRHTVSYEYY